MKKYLPLIAIVAVVAAIGIGVVALGDDEQTPTNPPTSPAPNSTPSPSPTSPTPPPSSAVATDEVEIEDQAFQPATITVKRGTTVTWTNKDDVAHTVTSDSNEGPNSQSLGRDDTYSYTFNTVGEFNYICSLHPDMQGKVIVTE